MNRRNANIVLSLVFLVLIFALPGNVRSQTTFYPLITWRTPTYVPEGFPGKALPVAGSSIVASLDVVTGGKFANLNNSTVRWFVNGVFFEEGRGLTQITIITKSIPGDNIVEVKVNVPDYQGVFIAKTIRIPITRPKTVIVQEATTEVRGIPYFFSNTDISSLLFLWTINDVKRESGATIAVSTDEFINGTANVQVTIKNPFNIFESSSANINISGN